MEPRRWRPHFSNPETSGSESSTSNLLRDSKRQSDVRRVDSWGTFSMDTPYTAVAGSKLSSITDKYSLSPDPRQWGSNLSPDVAEPDDELHNPYANGRDLFHCGGHPVSKRGFANLGCLIFLCVGLIGLFAGYPIATFVTRIPLSTLGGFNIGGINATGQVPSLPGNWGLIDLDTPKEAYKKPSWADPSQQMQLVFSDEFNVDGRSFYPGDDPYWEAVDLHYWATNDVEWYDPAALTTANGSLVITFSETQTHDLNYQSGMMSTWNKFCFTGGYVEASVQLPGVSNVAGFWPSVWTMGNLGRAGYGASLEGMWPYTYDACDVGTAPNQTHNGLPLAALANGDPSYNDVLSYLPGQKLSRCTCEGESHPGPKHADGTYVGRSAPEIDLFEAQVTGEPLTGQVSQSAQWAPMNHEYSWFNTSDNLIIANPSISIPNTYTGGITQQATSIVTNTNPDCYELGAGCYGTYGYQYKPGFDDAYIMWIANNQVAWTLRAAGMGPDTLVEISARPIPQEPMYLIVNLGMSTNFGDVDMKHLIFPARMRVDYIRVYQPENAINIGCDPPEFPTAAYIDNYIEAYTNPNLTTWRDDYKQPFPKNSFLGQC